MARAVLSFTVVPPNCWIRGEKSTLFHPRYFLLFNFYNDHILILYFRKLTLFL